MTAVTFQGPYSQKLVAHPAPFRTLNPSLPVVLLRDNKLHIIKCHVILVLPVMIVSNFDKYHVTL